MTAWRAADDAGRDLFALLGLPWGADTDAVRAAWRSTARRTHPDHGGDAEAFRSAQHARWVLTDEVRRAAYLLVHDRRAHAAPDSPGTTAAGSAGDRPFADEDDFFRGGRVEADDADFFDEGGWPPPSTSDDADDAEFFDEDLGASRWGSTGAQGDGTGSDPFGWDDDLDEDGDGWDPLGWDDELDGSAFDAGAGSASRGRSSRRTPPPPQGWPRPRFRCARCFRHALLGVDRCWLHASGDELTAAIRIAGPARCPVLNQRNRPCGARPSGPTAPFCIHHALGYWAAPARRAASVGGTAGPRTSGSDTRRAGPSARRQASGSRRDPSAPATGGMGSGTASRARPRTTHRAPTRQATTAATTASATSGCLPLLGFAGVVGVVLLVAGFLQEAVPGTSAVSALFHVLIGWWVLRWLFGRRARRR